MTPEKKLPGWVKPVAGAAGAAVLAAAAIGVATRGEPSQTQAPATETPSAAAASPTPKETPTVAPKTFEPTPTPTPEIKKEVPCLILPTEVCDKAELIHWKDSRGQEITFIGFKLPAGTPVFTPVDGQIAKAAIRQPDPFKGFYASIKDPKDPNVTYSFTGDIKFPDMASRNITSGTVIGTIDNTGAINLGDFNLLVGIDRLDQTQRKFFPAEDIQKRLFPTAFTKPAIEKSYEGPPNSAGTIIVRTTASPSSRP